MPRLILLIALLILAWLALRWFIRTPPREVIKTLRWTALVVLVLGLAFLVASGRLNWIFAAGAALLPFLKRGLSLLRYLPFLHGLLGRAKAARATRGPTPGQSSTVETRFLRMNLDHDSGTMDGEILEGRCEGRFLSQLTLAELLDLLAECQQADPDSAALLCAYLDRQHPRWRDQATAGAAGQQSTPTDSEMSKQEARDILGVRKDASETEIVDAHRRLMFKLHPDRGGSDYLAAKINQAKDCLLGK